MPGPVDRGGVADLRHEREKPERHQQDRGHVHAQQVAEVPREPLAVEQEEERRHGGVQEGDRMAEAGEREDDRERPPAASRFDAPVDAAEEDHRQTEREAEGELSGERRRDVAAPHRVPLVEEEREARHRPQRRNGEAVAETAQREQAGERQQERPAHRDELEGDVDRDDRPETDDRERRRKEVELVGRVAGEVAEIPALRVAGGQEDVPQVLDRMVIRGRVAASRHGVQEDE